MTLSYSHVDQFVVPPAAGLHEAQPGRDEGAESRAHSRAVIAGTLENVVDPSPPSPSESGDDEPAYPRWNATRWDSADEADRHVDSSGWRSTPAPDWRPRSGWRPDPLWQTPQGWRWMRRTRGRIALWIASPLIAALVVAPVAGLFILELIAESHGRSIDPTDSENFDRFALTNNSPTTLYVSLCGDPPPAGASKNTTPSGVPSPPTAPPRSSSTGAEPPPPSTRSQPTPLPPPPPAASEHPPGHGPGGHPRRHRAELSHAGVRIGPRRRPTRRQDLHQRRRERSVSVITALLDVVLPGSVLVTAT